MRKKKRRSILDEFFEGLEGDLSRFKGLEPSMLRELEGEYSVSVTQSGGRTIVRARIGKGVDRAKFRDDLERQYPGAEIIIEGGEPLIKEIGEVEEKTKERKKKTRIALEEEG